VAPAFFRVPARLPLVVRPLLFLADAERLAVALVALVAFFALLAPPLPLAVREAAVLVTDAFRADPPVEAAARVRDAAPIEVLASVRPVLTGAAAAAPVLIPPVFIVAPVGVDVSPPPAGAAPAAAAAALRPLPFGRPRPRGAAKTSASSSSSSTSSVEAGAPSSSSSSSSSVLSHRLSL
jgi:hypothetical protein